MEIIRHGKGATHMTYPWPGTKELSAIMSCGGRQHVNMHREIDLKDLKTLGLGTSEIARRVEDINWKAGLPMASKASTGK